MRLYKANNILAVTIVIFGIGSSPHLSHAPENRLAFGDENTKRKTYAYYY